MGVGYFMSQKYCSCLEITPTCCDEGWKVCMVGSSFNSPAKYNYAPIEGECLGVASALRKTRYYTQGCDKLLVCTDHKPLLGVLNDRSLESIDNPRLLRLKEKTLGWRFKLIHIPGRKVLPGWTDIYWSTQVMGRVSTTSSLGQLTQRFYLGHWTM